MQPTAQGELYGRVLGAELLRAFRAEYSLPLATVALAGAERVEALFKGFGSRLRACVEGAVCPLLLLCAFRLLDSSGYAFSARMACLWVVF